MQPIDKLREICLALPHAHEVEAWGEPTFRVKNKIFVMYALLLLLCSVSPVNAQQLSGGLHVSWLGIGGGTYSAKAVAATGLGARVSFTPDFARGHASISALYSTFPRDPSDTPSISAGGIDVALIANPRGLLRPFVGIGIGFIRFAPRAGEFPPCDPEQGCMSEGAPQFRRETALTLRPAAGLTAAVTSQFSLFGDLRLHLREDTPWNGSNYQPEFSLGLTYRSLRPL
jgi:hypothetical protein